MSQDEDEIETLNITSKPEDGDGAEAEGPKKEDRGDELAGGDDPDILKELAESVEKEPDQPAKPEPADKGVPYARFKEVNDELREARERLARLEGRVEAESKARSTPAAEPSKKVDLDALEEQYMIASIEGDASKVKALRAQIRAEEQRLAEEAAEARVLKRVEERDRDREEKQRQAAEEQEMARFKQVAAVAIAKHPELDINGEKADMKKIGDVKDWRDMYITRGHAPSAALAAAVQKVMGAAPAAKPSGAGIAGNDRKAASVARNVEVEKKIPPAGDGGSDGGKPTRVNVEKLTDAEYDALPEAEKKRLRGDVV